MGRAMAERLLDQGHQVTVWNRTPAVAHELATRTQVTVAETAAETFMSCRTVHSMLPDDEAVLELCGDDLLANVPDGRVHVNHATISPAAAKELAQRHARHRVGYISAPVLGRPTVISSGALLVVASGGRVDLEQAMPSLGSLGKKVWNLGDDPRLAAVVKIAVNYSLITALQSIAESVALAESAEVDPNVFVEILTHTAFTGSAHRGYGPMIAEKSYQPVGFAMPLGLKDLALATAFADERGVSLPFAPVLQELFEAATADPALANLDWSAVAEITRSRSFR